MSVERICVRASQKLCLFKYLNTKLIQVIAIPENRCIGVLWNDVSKSEHSNQYDGQTNGLNNDGYLSLCLKIDIYESVSSVDLLSVCDNRVNSRQLWECETILDARSVLIQW